MKQNIRREDLFARYGGEEFAVVLPEISIATAMTFGEKVRQLVQDAEFRFENTSIDVTISVGVAAIDEVVRDPEGLIKRADDQLYAAKAAGRNQVRG